MNPQMRWIFAVLLAVGWFILRLYLKKRAVPPVFKEKPLVVQADDELIISSARLKVDAFILESHAKGEEIQDDGLNALATDTTPPKPFEAALVVMESVDLALPERKSKH